MWFFSERQPNTDLGALRGTELRWQRQPKTQIFAENRRFSQIHRSLLLEIRKRAEYGFGGVRFRTPKSLSFWGLHWVPGSELSEFLPAYYLCAKANSPSFSQNSPSLPQNSVRLSEFSSPKQYSRNSIRPFPRNSSILGGHRNPQKTADFRRKPQIFAENRRFSQTTAGNCTRHLRAVTFSSALTEFTKFSSDLLNLLVWDWPLSYKFWINASRQNLSLHCDSRLP